MSEKKKSVFYQPPLCRGIGPGSVVDARGRRHVVRRLIDLDSVLALDLDSRQEVRLSVEETVPFLPTHESPAPDLATLSDEAWQTAIARYEGVREFLETPQRTASVARAIAEKHDISSTTLYRWVKRFQATGTVSGLIRPIRSDAGSQKLNERLERLMDAVIVKHYLKREAKSIRGCFRQLQQLCRRLKLDAPHYNTFRGRVNRIAPEVAAARRKGPKGALPFAPIEGNFPGADTPLDVIQIDHTRVDVILVDDIHRIPIGRPWITVAIDVYSRMVVGWYVSFNTPGTLGTGICVANAILPKGPILNQLGVAHPWPCLGKPRVIHADNAKEFRGNTLAMACQEHGVMLQFRKVKKPRYGAHIERLMGTLAQEIHTLPGTTFSNTAERGDYDSAGNAAITLSEFESWLAHLILGVYHHRQHEGIGMPPIVKYRQGILGDDKHPGIGVLPVPADPEKLRTDFLPLEERTIQPYGVMIDRILYYSDVLQPWIGAKENGSGRNKRKFIFRRDPRDISSILFFDPQLKRYFSIPYRNPSLPAITLWELSAVERFLKRQGKEAEDEVAIFAALDEMRRIEDNAVNLTQRVRREQRRLARRGIPTEKTVAPIPAGPPQQPRLPETDEVAFPSISELRPFDEVEDA